MIIALVATLLIPAAFAATGKTRVAEILEAAYRLADALGVEKSDYLVSLTRYQTPDNFLVDRKRSSAHNKEILAAVSGHIYWIACFGFPEPNTVGGADCLLIDEKTHRLLTRYQSK
jgi:hypothetical protein